MGGGGPLAWRVPSSVNCTACGCLAQSPGSHSCSASLSSAWGPLEEHGAGLPAWTPQEKPGPGTAPGVIRSSQGMPKGCAQACGPCPTCGSPELPPAPCSSWPGAGPLLSQHSLHSGLFSGCGLCMWSFCMRMVVPLCCPHVHPHACLCALRCVSMCVCPRVCVCPCESMCVSVCIPVCCHVSGHPAIHLRGATDREGLAWGDWGQQEIPCLPGAREGPGSRV